jgi:hypothetical protein
MKTIYVPVKCSDELPDRKGDYAVLDKRDEIYTDTWQGEAWVHDQGFDDTTAWLKPITLPDEEEMEREFMEYLQMDTIPDKDDPEHYDYSWGRVVWMACYDHIKRLLK